MTLGVGCDLIEVERVRRALERSGKFRELVYTRGEVEYCEGRGASKYESYAARFAGKEAILKALGVGIIHSLREVEIEREESGRPRVKLHGETEREARRQGASHIHLSLSHTKSQALAYCVIER